MRSVLRTWSYRVLIVAAVALLLARLTVVDFDGNPRLGAWVLWLLPVVPLAGIAMLLRLRGSLRRWRPRTGRDEAARQADFALTVYSRRTTGHF